MNEAQVRAAADRYITAIGFVPARDLWTVEPVPGHGWRLHVPTARSPYRVLVTTGGWAGGWSPRLEPEADAFERIAAHRPSERTET